MDPFFHLQESLDSLCISFHFVSNQRLYPIPVTISLLDGSSEGKRQGKQDRRRERKQDRNIDRKRENNKRREREEKMSPDQLVADREDDLLICSHSIVGSLLVTSISSHVCHDQPCGYEWSKCYLLLYQEQLPVETESHVESSFLEQDATELLLFHSSSTTWTSQITFWTRKVTFWTRQVIFRVRSEGN